MTRSSLYLREYRLALIELACTLSPSLSPALELELNARINAVETASDAFRVITWLLKRE
jgi:hypothetical protein